MLARATNREPTKAMANCARHVLKYLATTKDQGLIYSPETEKRFYDSLKRLEEHSENVN